MSFLDKFLNVMRLNPDDDDDFYNDDYEEEEELPVKQKSSPKPKKERSFEDDYKEKPAKSAAKVTPIRPSKRQTANGMEVCVIKPVTMEDAREITDTLLNNCTVILNVEGLDVQISQRIIDFTAGATYAIDGKLQKVSNYILVLTPASVDISGDFLNLVDSLDTSGI